MDILVECVFGEAGVSRVNKGFCVYLKHGMISKVLINMEGLRQPLRFVFLAWRVLLYARST